MLDLTKIWIPLLCCSLGLTACRDAGEPNTPQVHTAPAPQADSILSARDASFYLHGAPFAEISFNKFDLFWQVLDAELGRSGHGADPLAAAEASLAVLHAHGFQTIRAFFHDSGRVDTFLDPAQRERFFAAMDRTLDLCDRHGLRVVVSLGLADPKWAKHANESFTAQISRQDSDWFTSYAQDRERALPVIAKALDKIVAARVPLTHWWAFDSARNMDQRKPQRMDFTPTETPEFIALVADANRRLQLAALGFTYVPDSVKAPVLPSLSP